MMINSLDEVFEAERSLRASLSLPPAHPTVPISSPSSALPPPQETSRPDRETQPTEGKTETKAVPVPAPSAQQEVVGSATVQQTTPPNSSPNLVAQVPVTSTGKRKPGAVEESDQPAKKQKPGPKLRLPTFKCDGCILLKGQLIDEKTKVKQQDERNNAVIKEHEKQKG